MDATPSIAILLAIALIAANLPFFSGRIFFFRQPADGKSLAWRLLELLTLYIIVGALALRIETQVGGVPYSQGWEFYAITLGLFLVLAYPGFVWRYLWHGRRG